MTDNDMYDHACQTPMKYCKAGVEYTVLYYNIHLSLVDRWVYYSYNCGFKKSSCSQ